MEVDNHAMLARPTTPSTGPTLASPPSPISSSPHREVTPTTTENGSTVNGQAGKGDLESGYSALPGEGLKGGNSEGLTTNAGTDPEKGTTVGGANGTAIAPAPAMTFPDGGVRAWTVVGGAWCISFISWGYVNAFGVYQSFYQTHQLADRSPDAISWIGSIQLALVLASAIVSGKLFDAGYIKYLLVAGTCIYTAGLIGLSFATTYSEILVAQGIACGMAAGIVFLPAVSSISHHFQKRRATALGILATGSSIGGVVYPILLNKMFEKGYSFGFTVRASAYLTMGLLVIACLTIDTRLPARKNGRFIDFSVFNEPIFTTFTIGVSFIIWGLYTPYFYLQTYSIEHGVDPTLAFYSLSVLNAASMFGRIIPNYFADKYGPLTILLPNCAASGILIFVWLALGKSEAGMWVFALLFGFTSGAYVSMMPACIATITVTNGIAMNQIGIRMAMGFLMVSLFALTGTPISGAIITKQKGSFVGAAVCSGVMVLIGTVLVFFARLAIVKKRGTQWV